MNNNETIVLQIVLGHEADEETEAHWTKRFGRWYSPGKAMIEYPVSCDSHGFDVFNDEFVDVPTWTGYAGILSIPMPPEEFVPFTEDSSGSVLYEWDDEKEEWTCTSGE